MTALRDFTVVELAERPAGEFCGKLLADFGADLVKVERPGGSPTRAMAPVVGRDGAPNNGGLFAYLNTNKKSVVLDLATRGGLDALHRIIAAADVVIDDHDEGWLRPLGLDPLEAERRYAHLIFCAITPFGRGAPEEWRCAKSLNVFHVSGWGYHTPGWPDPTKPPLKGPGRFLVDYDSALDAAMCIAAALYWREGSGRGQFIDLSELEAMVSRVDTHVGRMIAGEVKPGNDRAAYDSLDPAGFFPCADGHVYLYMTSKAHWQGLGTLMGNPAWMAQYEDNWLEFSATPAKVADCKRHFAAWVRPMPKIEVSEKAQKLGVPLVSVNDAADLHRSPQYAFRKFFQRIAHPVLGEALYPTVPYRLSASPAQITRAAPLLGEHTAEILGRAARALARPLRSRGQGAQTPSRPGPLAGVRVLELTKVWAGPYTGKLLAFLGAEVIKVESNHNLDEMRGYGGVDPNNAPYFLSLNPEILSVQVNLKRDAGVRQLHGMVAKSDIVLNNLRPGAMERLGLGYEGMRAIKRDIISVSIKMYGNDGPLGYQTGYAPCFAALGGLNYLVGYEGGPPLGISRRYGDSSAGAAAALAAVIALVHRARTGEGQFVDLSAVESLSMLVGDSLFEYSVTGRAPGPDGNVHADMAPHGCYPCRAGAWLSLAVESDDAWRNLCAALGKAALAADKRFGTLSDRQAHRKVLDEILAEVTKEEDAEALGSRLRAAGVAAFKSHSSLDVTQDDYLWGRDFFRFVTDARQGARPVIGASWRMSATPATISRGAPALGQHNCYVYRDVLGLSQEQFQELVRRRVVE